MKILHFDQLESTNKYCELLDLSRVEEFTVVSAASQTAGVGQRGSHWESQPGENLTFSMVLKPTFLSAARQYELTKAVALGIVDWVRPVMAATASALATPAQAVRIKWPNDIYVGQRKLCGVLVSNHVGDGVLRSSVVGVGLNVNQTQFGAWVPNPVSLAMLTGVRHDTRMCLEGLADALARRYGQLRAGAAQAIGEEYEAALLRRGEEAAYAYRGKPLRATLRGVDRYGHLLLTTADGVELACDMGELKFLF